MTDSILYKEFGDPEIAVDLLRSLDANRRERRTSDMEKMYFTHSSRNAWSKIRKLGVGKKKFGD